MSSSACNNANHSHQHYHHHRHQEQPQQNNSNNNNDSHIAFIEQNLHQIEQDRSRILEDCSALRGQVHWLKKRQEVLEKQLADSSQKLAVERAQVLQLQTENKKMHADSHLLKDKLARNHALTEKFINEKSDLYKQISSDYIPLEVHEALKKEVR